MDRIQHLCRKPWHTIWAIDATNSQVTYKFLMKESFERFPYILLVTDCYNLWSQTSSTEMFKSQVQELLPGSVGSSHSEQSLLNLIREKLLETSTSSPSDKPQFSVQRGEDSLILSLDIVLSELSFVWTFHCVRWKEECQLVLSELLVYPLLNTLKVLNDEKYALIDIISRKDKEISEYKSFFGTLPKISVSTQPFSLENFDNVWKKEQDISSITKDLWIEQHIADLFASATCLDEYKTRKLSQLLCETNSEALRLENATEQSKVKMDSKTSPQVGIENVESKDTCINESSAELDENEHSTELQIRRKLLSIIPSEGNVEKKVKKKKRLF
jgi:hypothetical protein